MSSVRLSARPSVMIRYGRDQIGWNSSKIISRPNSLMRSLTPNMGDLVQREHPHDSYGPSGSCPAFSCPAFSCAAVSFLVISCLAISTNVLSKYADDINLLVPQYCDVDMASEFDQVLCWAKRNKMV